MIRSNLFALSCLASLLAPLAIVACSDDPPAGPTPNVPTGTVDGGGGQDSAVPSTCAPVTGAGTTHDTSPTADETWTAADSPHIVDTNLSIATGRTLTVEPCAVVQLKSGVEMLVEGKLLAVGAADKPIRFERGDAGEAWTKIEARKGSELRFAYAILEGGGFTNGSAPTTVATLDIRGDQDSAPQPILFVDNVTVKGSESLGILLREGGAFAPGSKALSITGGAGFPISIWARAAGTLPSGSYAGNATDEIILPSSGGVDDIKEDTTLAALGVPYRIGGPTGGKRLTVAGSGSVPLLTIKAGAKLRFDKETRLEIGATSNAATGALRVEGTAASPVVFESAAASPVAGDWVGIVIGGTPDARDSIAYATISHAGGASQISSYGCLSPDASSFANEAAILIYGGGAPTSAFVTNTKIENSAGEGIVRGWTGDVVDFLPTNTFTNVVGCNQSYPKPSVGSCPDPAPCPK